MDEIITYLGFNSSQSPDSMFELRHVTCAFWASELDESSHLAQVSSLYGPGAVGCWLMIVCSTVVSWTVNKSTRDKDTVTNDLIGALTLPIVAGVHLIDQIVKYPGSRTLMFLTMDPSLSQRAAAVEASLSICETFSAIALPLAAISMYNQNAKRFFMTSAVGLFCLSLQVMLTILSPIPLPGIVTLSRTPLIHNLVLTAIITSVVAFLFVAALYVWIQIAMDRRRAKILARKKATQEQELEALRLQQHQAQNHDEDINMNKISAREVQLSKTIGLLSAGTSVFLPISFAASFFGTTGTTPLEGLHTIAWRLRFFIPESNTSVNELDQVTALVGGAAVLAFSCYDAYKSWTQTIDN